MAAYTGGAVKITSGSSKVYGTLTDWTTYLGVGDLFKIQNENVVYEVAAINTATELTLTSRYARTSLQGAIASNLASVTIATRIYSGNVGSFTPVIQNGFIIEASPNGGGERFADNGAGVLIGGRSPGPGSGTIDYDSGAWSIILGTKLTATLNLTASFTRGVSSSGEVYQAVVDFTPNYSIPEMSTNDINFAHIYTRAMRIIDQKIKSSNTKIVPKKGDYAATPSDNTIVVGGNTASVVIRLPYANLTNLGVRMTIINNSASVVKASACSGQTVNASGAAFLKTVNQSVTVTVATDAKWVKI